MLMVLRWVTTAVGLVMAGGTLLSLSRSQHWLVRGWDFPRVQIASLAGGSGVAYALLFHGGAPFDWLFLAAISACVLWQVGKIYPYTPLAPVRVKQSERPVRVGRGSAGASGPSFRLLIANVLMENTRYERLLGLIRESDPDVVLAVETDDRWGRALKPLARTHPHVVGRLQDNYYGFMLFSRFPLLDVRVEFLVHDDVPSVHASFELAGERVFLHGLHPRPPTPTQDQDSTPRDAELVLVGRAIAERGSRPTVVAGDLNDVAWSRTTELFLRVSGLLDPRMGRGFYNSYNANLPCWRFPLDHVFHSNHFRLVELRRCEHVGSDHFPVLIELSYEPEAPREQPESGPDAGDAEEAEEKLEAQADAARTGDDRPGRE